jgi:hypothetical protein
MGNNFEFHYVYSFNIKQELLHIICTRILVSIQISGFNVSLIVSPYSVVLVRERTIPIERPPLVGEVSATFADKGVTRHHRDGSIRPYCRISRPEPLVFLSSSSSVVLTRLSGPRSRPTTSRKICSAGNRTRTSGSVARNSDH